MILIFLFYLGILAFLIWLLYRLYKKKPKKYRDKLRRDYIKIKQKVKRRKPKKSKIEELISNVRKEREELVKEREKNAPKFEESGDVVKCNFRGKTFLLDKEGYKFFKNEFIIFGGLSIINNYLAIDNPANDWIIFFHREFMRIEREDFCLENNCEGKDIVVHHVDFSTTNNRKENLKVMFEKEHKKIHNR